MGKDEEIILAKWLSGELSEEEIQKLNLEPGMEVLKRMTETAKDLEAPSYDIESQWERLNEARNKETAKLRNLPQTKQPARSRKLRWLAAAAAIAILAVALNSLFTKDSANFASESGNTKHWPSKTISVRPYTPRPYSKKRMTIPYSWKEALTLK